jgi:uncharacterized protein (DUF342 family)
MKEETFRKAEELRNKISYCKRNISECEKLLERGIEQTRIIFKNPDVLLNDVHFQEDKGFIKTALKIALIEFKESLSLHEKELDEL